ncbi:MAG: transcriptional repressor LexA [Deltaproteobacteria bacterium]|nr:transcriptional repressor LexA [Deltaproteobacteria bacterium]
MKILTPKQKKVLDFIRSYSDRAGYAPSQQEIAAAFGFRSLGTVQNYLVRLERQGFLVKNWNARRGMRVIAPEINGTELPLAGRVAAGKPIEAVTTPDFVEVPSSMAGSGENYVLRVQGDSMIGDGILDGDLVVVRKQATADNGQTVVALIRGEATVKRFYRKGERIELHPANPTLSPILVENEEDFHIDGVVVGVIRHCL